MRKLLLEDEVKRRGDTGIVVDDGLLVDVGMDVESLIVPSNVVEIDENVAFGHTKLDNITFPDSVTTIKNGAFQSCTELTKVNFGKGLKTIEAGAFEHCTHLHTLIIPDNVQAIYQEAFARCFDLTSIELGKGIRFIGSHAFKNTELESIKYAGTLEEWCQIKYNNPYFPYLSPYILYINHEPVTEFIPAPGITKINDGAFRCNDALETVVLPNSVTYVGTHAFAHCSNLKTVKLGNGVQKLNMDLFHSCASLSSVYIPDSVTSIGSRVFAFCHDLEKITYGGTKEQWHKINKVSTWRGPSSASITIKCTDGNIFMFNG